MDQRVIYPPPAEHSRLRQPLTSGEKEVFRLFERYLNRGWEIYIQPHLNGLRPDFVLLNPNVGIAVFEVKDWDLDAMRYFTKENQSGHRTLWAEKNGKEFCLQKDNPIPKVNLYKKEIFDLYCPRLERSKGGFAAITAGVIFPYASTEKVRSLLSPFIDNYYTQYHPVTGMDELAQGNIGKIFPEGSRRCSRLMSEQYAEDLRGWLVEPDFSVIQRLPLVLDRNQEALTKTRTQTGYRRIKGPAGSGKSVVLAARAANLANEGKSVLIVTFNITLCHYLRDIIARALDAPDKIDNIEFRHFHLWCRNVCYDVGWDEEYGNLWSTSDSKRTLEVDLPELAEKALKQPGAKRYDAILVDEGQDYQPLWWNVLRKACVPSGEMLLVADATQDIYGTAKAWTDDVMKGAGFPGGRWAQLKVSYRLPPDSLKLARDFAKLFLPKETIDLPEPKQREFDFTPSHLRWVQCSQENGDKVCADEVLALMRNTGINNNVANADIVVLTSDKQSGSEVVGKLDEYKIQTVNTFGEDDRRKKMGFYMGNAKIKATTVHSFKGWETRMLVVYVSEAKSIESLALVYVGLTRLKHSKHGSWLTVVCSSEELHKYGQTFPDYTLHDDRL